MLSPDVLTSFMDTNKFVLDKQLEGLTHEDSIQQLPFRGNCLNWVMGHIVDSRDNALRVLSCDPYMSEEQSGLYKSGSDPITPDSDALQLEWLWETYLKQDEDIRDALSKLTVDDLEKVQSGSERTIGDRLRGLMWHETYHVGQTEYLRQLAGTNDFIV